MHAAHDGGRHRLCVDWAGGDACVRVFASGTRFLEGPGKEMLGKGTKEGTCSLSDLYTKTRLCPVDRRAHAGPSSED